MSFVSCYALMRVKTVQPPLQFIPPAFNPWVVSTAQKLLPLWLRSRFLGRVRADGVERLLKLYRQFQGGKTRFPIAFRHPTLDNSICLSYLLGHIDDMSDRIHPLEPSVAQLAFWCLEDLLSAERFEQVVILPVGIKYRYVRTSWQTLEKYLKRLEKESGLSVNDSSMLPIIPCPEQRIFGRLMRLTEFLLFQVEDFYNRFYRQSLSGVGSFDDRLQACHNAALSVAESYFALQAGYYWSDCEVQKLEALPGSKREHGNRAAQMRERYLWHLSLAEHLSVPIANYVREKLTFERLAESSLVLGRAIARIKGRYKPSYRLPGQQIVEITVGNAISVSQRWDAYRTNRRLAVEALTQDLQTALKATISQPTTELEKVLLLN